MTVFCIEGLTRVGIIIIVLIIIIIVMKLSVFASQLAARWKQWGVAVPAGNGGGHDRKREEGLSRLEVGEGAF